MFSTLCFLSRQSTQGRMIVVGDGALLIVGTFKRRVPDPDFKVNLVAIEIPNCNFKIIKSNVSKIQLLGYHLLTVLSHSPEIPTNRANSIYLSTTY